MLLLTFDEAFVLFLCPPALGLALALGCCGLFVFGVCGFSDLKKEFLVMKHAKI